LKNKLLFFFAAALLLVSCKKDEANNASMLHIEGKKLPSVSNEKREATRLIVTKALANALKHEEVRNYLKGEFKRKFDNDFDILYTAHKKDVLFNGKTFAQVLWESSRETPNNTRVLTSLSLEYFMDSISIYCPLLNIGLPETSAGTAINWNTQTTLPKVINRPISFNAQTETFVTAYDANGNSTQVNAKVQPTEIFIVVGTNERLYAFTKTDSRIANATTLYAYLEDDFLKYFFADEYNEYENGLTIFGLLPHPDTHTGGESDGECERDARQNKDELSRVKFNSKGEIEERIEPWIDGRIELYCIISFAQYIDPTNAAFSSLRKNCSRDRGQFFNTWWFSHDDDTYWTMMEDEVIKWDLSTIGSPMKYSWYEEDPGNKLTLTLSIPVEFKIDGVGVGITGGGTYEINDKDANCGESFVEYCDPATMTSSDLGETYNTGTVKFQVRER
jgi:hypothetical protein